MNNFSPNENNNRKIFYTSNDVKNFFQKQNQFFKRSKDKLYVICTQEINQDYYFQ